MARTRKTGLGRSQREGEEDWEEAQDIARKLLCEKWNEYEAVKDDMETWIKEDWYWWKSRQQWIQPAQVKTYDNGVLYFKLKTGEIGQWKELRAPFVTIRRGEEQKEEMMQERKIWEEAAGGREWITKEDVDKFKRKQKLCRGYSFLIVSGINYAISRPFLLGNDQKIYRGIPSPF